MSPSIVGHAPIVARLAGALARGRLGHALLFVGPAGAGRETVARALAAGVLCERSGESPARPFGCAACRACAKLAGGVHPDLHVVTHEAEAIARGFAEPEGRRKPSRVIKVDQIRELSRVMRMRPHEGRARVAIVVDAHHLNQNAANALLKTLEEPPPDSLLVLTAPHARAVLPTIASRCQRVAFGPLREEQVAEVLRRQGVADAEARARLAEGSVARALALDLDEAASVRARTELLLERLFDGDGSAALDAAEQVGRDRAEAEALLEAVEHSLAAQLRALVQASAADPPRAARRLHEALEAIARARSALAGNAHVQLTFEELLLGARSYSRESG